MNFGDENILGILDLPLEIVKTALNSAVSIKIHIPGIPTETLNSCSYNIMDGPFSQKSRHFERKLMPQIGKEVGK